MPANSSKKGTFLKDAEALLDFEYNFDEYFTSIKRSCLGLPSLIEYYEIIPCNLELSFGVWHTLRQRCGSPYRLGPPLR